MAQSEAQKRATARYQKENTKSVSIRFMPGDADILAWLDEQPSKAGYVKALIRADMEARTAERARKARIACTAGSFRDAKGPPILATDGPCSFTENKL